MWSSRVPYRGSMFMSTWSTKSRISSPPGSSAAGVSSHPGARTAPFFRARAPFTWSSRRIRS